MKLSVHVIRNNPNHIEEVMMEDVSEVSITDSKMLVYFNNSPYEEIPLRANDGEENNEWAGFCLFGTRIGMKVDMNS